MTVRPKKNPNINDTSLNKSYHNDKLAYQRLVICLWHPDFNDMDVLDGLRWLRENDH